MRIKVCCIRSIQEATLALEAGADALGLVSKMPTGNHGIPDDAIRTIAESIPPTYSIVLLTISTDPTEVVAHQKRTGANTLQLVGPIEPDAVRRVRDALPGIALLKVIHVVDARSLEAAAPFFDCASAILLDSKAQVADGEALGGTGLTHDWSISRKIVEASPLPAFLAGGLTSQNVDDAIAAVQPFGVDACTGLRTNGALDPERLRDFVSRARPSTGSTSTTA